MKIKVSGKPVKVWINGVLCYLSAIKSGPIPPTPPAPSSLEWVQTSVSSKSYQLDVVRYGADKFFAPVKYIENDGSLGYVGKFLYSFDGITWNETDLPAETSYDSCIYDNNTFLVSGGGTYYSYNGFDWTRVKDFYSFNSLAYGGNKFVGVTWDTQKLGYSTDGINWEESTLPVSDRWTSVSFGDSKFVSISGDKKTKNAAYSEDGIVWSLSSLPIEAFWYEISYGNGRFVAVGEKCAAYSLDGAEWLITSIPSGVWTSVTYGGGKFVAIARGGNYAEAKAAYSTDGINWVEIAKPPHADWTSITYGNGKFVAVSDSSVSAYLAWDNGAKSDSKIGTAKIGTAKVVSG